MAGAEKIPLKTYWEAVEQRLAACSADELRAILRAIARETPPTRRQAFLDKLESVEEMAVAAPQTIQQENLLADIADLVQELSGEMEGAEYWEDRFGWGEYYDEEDSLGPYAKYVEPLVDLFDRAEAAFDYGQLPLARTAYRELFELLDLEDDYGRGVHTTDLTGVDLDEAWARYLRAVYELEPLDERPRTLFEQMRQRGSGLLRRYLGLEDLIQISPRPLPEQEQFLADWISFLRTQAGSEADGWLREAVRLSQGTPGLEILARTEGQARPRAYLDWLKALAQVSLREDKQPAILAWCVDVAQRRAEAIVSGQHRKSYDKAAVVTTACAEVLRLRGDRAAADSLLSEVRNRFPRHRAFQAELKSAVQQMERRSLP